MKNIVVIIAALSFAFLTGCSSDDVLEEQTVKEAECTYQLTCTLAGTPKSAVGNTPETKAAPSHTGEVSADDSLSRIYDLPLVYLIVDNKKLEIPVYTAAEGIRCFDLTVKVRPQGRLTFINGANAVDGPIQGDNNVFFTSLPDRNVENELTDKELTSQSWGTNKVRKPIGDGLFRSDIYKFDGTSSALYIKLGNKDLDPEDLRIRMNRCTCVFQPVVIVTDGDDRMDEATFSAALGNPSEWSAWAVLERVPVTFDLWWTEPFDGDHYVGRPSLTQLAPVQVMNDFTVFTAQQHDDDPATGVGAREVSSGKNTLPFIYWHTKAFSSTNPLGKLLVTIRHEAGGVLKEKQLTVHMNGDYNANTVYKIYILLDYMNLKQAFDKLPSSASTRSVGLESLDIPYRVVVKEY